MDDDDERPKKPPPRRPERHSARLKNSQSQSRSFTTAIVTKIKMEPAPVLDNRSTPRGALTTSSSGAETLLDDVSADCSQSPVPAPGPGRPWFRPRTPENCPPNGPPGPTNYGQLLLGNVLKPIGRRQRAATQDGSGNGGMVGLSGDRATDRPDTSTGDDSLSSGWGDHADFIGK